jgi:hypothetical protein
MFVVVLPLLLTIIAYSSVCNAEKAKAKSDPDDNKGNTPFFLQDDRDSMCLGPNGFTICDERALWILTKRSGLKTYSLVSLLNPSPYGMCLEKKSGFLGVLGSSKVEMGPCNKKGSKSWEFDFIDKAHVRLSINGMCLVRGKKTYR